MLQLEIASLGAGFHSIEYTPTANELDLDPEVFSDIKVQFSLDLAKRQISVSMQVEAIVKLQCDRTLVMFDQPLSGKYAVLFSEALPGGDAEDVLPFSANDRVIDVTKPVRDTLVLAVPSRKVAPEAEDVDIQLSYKNSETEDEVDPRWAALRNLKTDSDN